MIRKGKAIKFYHSKEWRALRKKVLAQDKYECQHCKSKGYYTRANHVHHVKRLEAYPELALETHYTDADGEHRQLISLCKQCHMKVHDYQHKPKEPLTVERW